MTSSKRTVARSLATFFGVGYAPISGTAASAVALPIGWWIGLLAGAEGLTVAALLATVIGIWACGAHARAIGVKDPSECVMDEVAGQWIALIAVAAAGRLQEWLPSLVAFFLFRFFDIVKPWPINRLEELPGGLGIMMDDVLAGIFSALILFTLLATHVM